MFTVHHIVSEALYLGRRLVQAMWLCRGLSQDGTCRQQKALQWLKEQGKNIKEQQFEELK